MNTRQSRTGSRNRKIAACALIGASLAVTGALVAGWTLPGAYGFAVGLGVGVALGGSLRLLSRP